MRNEVTRTDGQVEVDTMQGFADRLGTIITELKGPQPETDLAPAAEPVVVVEGDGTSPAPSEETVLEPAEANGGEAAESQGTEPPAAA